MAAVPAALLPIPGSLGLLTMLIAGLSILDAIPVFVAALVGLLAVQGFGLIKPDQPENDNSEGEKKSVPI
jgi:hypothetical protein